MNSPGVEKPMLELLTQKGKTARVPELPTPIEESHITHSEMVYRIASLGRAIGFQVWVGKNEQSDSYNGIQLASISLPILSMPVDRKVTEKQRRKIEQIDIIWFDGRNVPAFAFEIENTPVITSALDRFTYLLSVEPEIARQLVVIAPSSAKSRVNDELGKSAYVGHPMYMENKVRYVFYPDIVELYDAARDLTDRDVVTRLLGILRDPRLDK
jgi:hypothetical protein